MLIKRIFDLLASFFGLIVLSPLLIFIALIIGIKMGRFILFRQKRIGQYGKEFVLVKFRTMNLQHNNNSITVNGENRITPLGAKLRKYKLDELPELWNVLKGEMSFVGPRPDVPGYSDKLKGDNAKILNLKPGITGPASIKYKNEEEILAQHENYQKYNDTVIFPNKTRININYISNRTFWGDIKIILYTIFGKELEEEYYQ